MTTTKDTLTIEQIAGFRANAGEAGDRVACAVCDIARRDEVSETLQLDEDESWRLERLDLDGKEIDGVNVTRQEAARALVAEWIADGEAQS